MKNLVIGMVVFLLAAQSTVSATVVTNKTTYHPSHGTLETEPCEPEFLELLNIGPDVADLSGGQLANWPDVLRSRSQS